MLPDFIANLFCTDLETGLSEMWQHALNPGLNVGATFSCTHLHRPSWTIGCINPACTSTITSIRIAHDCTGPREPLHKSCMYLDHHFYLYCTWLHRPSWIVGCINPVYASATMPFILHMIAQALMNCGLGCMRIPQSLLLFVMHMSAQDLVNYVQYKQK